MFTYFGNKKYSCRTKNQNKKLYTFTGSEEGLEKLFKEQYDNIKNVFLGFVMIVFGIFLLIKQTSYI